MDDFMFDSDEEDLESNYISTTDANEDDDSEDTSNDSDIDLEDDEGIGSKKLKASDYDSTKMTADEVWLSTAYDDIVAAGKHDSDNAIEIAASIVIRANPKNTSATTVGNKVKELLHRQGHSRMVNSIYTSDTPLRGEDVSSEYFGSDEFEFNKQFEREARDIIARFIDYLATRDLSKDSIISKRRKQRHIPAFIIFLFSSGMYDLILNCPTMPKEYDVQIKRAFDKIQQEKYNIVEALAQRYEDLGRDKVAARVRKLQLAWFDKEPAEIRTTAEYRDLDLTYEDVLTYREFRPKFTNTSKAITQDVISDMIEVVLDTRTGIKEKLKDKTRGDAITDVKKVYKEWSESIGPDDSELATKIIWGLKN